ncbi:hypothetical protein C8R44DRAFT_856359 [Mycena epipterygia]|nr:hypothetical protein C8R44DRAFT_856359 [Mycena epipterygia]
MPANQTPELPGIRDMFPEHFPPRRPQPPTEPRRAPQGPDPDNDYLFGVLKHNPRNASLDVFKHNHPLPDPKRWYSQSADASFLPPTLAEHVEGTADGGSTPEQVDGASEKMNDTQPQGRSPYPSCRCALNAKAGASAHPSQSTPFPLPDGPRFPVTTSPPMRRCPRCGGWQEVQPPLSPGYFPPVTTWRGNSAQMRPSHQDFSRKNGEPR